ncbi:protein Iojap, chloroplastic [Sesamum angolense]|uniref:Protein Iojap, chloroplastic n=1 Tax=Sesamum angolense TaxID=2727404 RepID=A0AAE2BVD3_9LAMI|nr:protein Iojap, chloroplastic [Sesamum angolense]
MIIYSGPLHHQSLASCTRSSISGGHFRRECELFPRPRNLSLSNFKRCQSLQIPGSQKSLLTRMAVGSNVSEDTDDMFDDLFKKYGKVVFKRNDQKPVSSEVDDDAESLSFAVALAKVASDVKAADIKLLFVKPLVYWTRFFIIATAFSRPQIDAIGTRIRDLAETQYGKQHLGMLNPTRGHCWTSVMWLYIFFFLNKGLSTTWKSFTAMQHISSYLLRTNNHFVNDKAVRSISLLWTQSVLANEAAVPYSIRITEVGCRGLGLEKDATVVF